MSQNLFEDENNLATVSPETLARLKAMTDDELLRKAGTLDQFSVVESSRRLRRATERLTYVLIGLNVLLVVLTVILVILTIILVNGADAG
jgi:hypothetical protein